MGYDTPPGNVEGASMRRIALSWAAVMLAVGLVACGGDEVDVNPPGGGNGADVDEEEGGEEGEDGGEEGDD